MYMKRVLGCCMVLALSMATNVAASDIADAAMNGDIDAVRDLLSQQVDVDEPQVDGATALHWAAYSDDLETARLLLSAGANASVVNRVGATPMQLASVNGNVAMMQVLLQAGADANAPLNDDGDTALMMAARTGNIEALELLLAFGADVNAKETWSYTTPLMWAVAEGHADAVRILVDHSADLAARTIFVPSATGRGFEGPTPRDRLTDGTEDGPLEHASGEFTPLMFAAREGDLESARVLVEAGADLNARAADGKDSLGLAIFNGNYDVASFLIDSGADVNQADARGFAPLYWAVDRRNMETAPNFTWVVTEDPLPLVRQLLDAGADPNLLINNSPRARMREGSPRIKYATVLHRAAFSGDIELVRTLLEYGADPNIKSSDNESALGAATGNGLIIGYQPQGPVEDRLAVVQLLVELGNDVNWHDDYGITPLMTAANLGDPAIEIVQYLIDQGADLGAYDLGKKNDGSFGASTEPLMPIDYAIGVGTFKPNNAIVLMQETMELMKREMDARGIEHTTSECTLRGFTCSTLVMDPRAATPKNIEEARALLIGHQVEGITAGVSGVGGLSVDEEDQEDEEEGQTPQ